MIVVETERLLFRPHEPADLEAYCAMEADPEVRRWVGGAPRTREGAERKFRSVHLQAGKENLGLRATMFKQDDCYIGYCGLYPNFQPGGAISGEAVLAFYLARSYWGRGLATEAGHGFIEFGFAELGLRRIVADVEVGNDASIRVLAKLGFTLVGTETGVRSFHNYELRNLGAGGP